MTPLCIHRFEAIGSTNDEAMRLLREGAPEGTVVWAERQTAGRGRMGRSWQSVPGNLSLSVIARPVLPAALAGRLGVSCGLAVARSLRAVTGLPLRTKWPNDLYLDGRKAGGILVETRFGTNGALDGVVAGVGINVASHPDVPPPGRLAVSLAARGWAGSAEELVGPLARAALRACHGAGEPGWLERVAEDWAAHDLAAGAIRVREGVAEYDAVGVALADDGALVITRTGRKARLEAGEVSIRVADAA
jgi:BirA family biotin operon repressor/biotin-[acetyl-CoA-carboxylase] ligase